MRIISKFKDYYDIGLSYGIDPNLTFIRETKKIDTSYDDKNIPSEFKECLSLMPEIKFKDYNSTKHIIGFCGKTYPCISLQKFSHSYFFYSIVELRKYLIQKRLNENHLIKNKTLKPYISGYYNVFEIKKLINNNIGGIFNKMSCEEFDNKFYGKRIADDFFRFNNSPIFVLESKSFSKTLTFKINPLLRNYNFSKEIDPYTAFQELSMYIGSNLVKQKDPNPKFSDELKREIAGFDKWSFKKKGKKSK
jgi:hypothetical protein